MFETGRDIQIKVAIFKYGCNLILVRKIFNLEKIWQIVLLSGIFVDISSIITVLSIY